MSYRRKRRFALLGVGFWLFACSSCTSVLGPSFRAGREAGGSVADAARTGPPAIDMVFVLDQSQSMGGGHGEVATDPHGLRFQAVRYAIESLNLKSNAAAPHRVGLVQFGSNAPQDLAYPLTAVSDVSRIQALTGLLANRNLVWTNFTEALRRAAALLDEGGAIATDRLPAIILLTDGSPDDPRHLTRDGYFKEIAQVVAQDLQSRVSFYVIGIDTTGQFWHTDEPEWRNVTGGKTYGVSQVSDLNGTFNDIVRDVLRLPQLPRDDIRPGRSPFDVGPYLEQIEFHIFGAAPSKLSLLDPTGRPIRPQEWSGADYRILRVAKPAPGRWFYELGGVAPVSVYRNEVPVRPRLVLPRLTNPIGKKMRVAAEILYQDDSSLDEHPDFPIRVTAVIRAGDRVQRSMQLTRHQNLYESSEQFEVSTGQLPPALDVILHAGTAREYLTSFPIQPVHEPFFDVSLQCGGAIRHYGSYITVRAQLFEGNHTMSGNLVFRSPESVIRAQLVRSPRGPERGQSVWLDSSSKDGLYSVSLPAPVDRPGRYEVRMAIGGVLLKDGHRIDEYIEPIWVDVIPTWVDRAISGGEMLARVLLGALILVVVAFLATCVWVIRLPRMRGGTLTVSRTSSVGGTSSLSSKHYSLRGRFLLCRQGKLLLVCAVRPSRAIARLPRVQPTDYSKQRYAILYPHPPLIGRLECTSGGTLRIGLHTLTFK
jgi:uncharacterized protein YegL